MPRPPRTSTATELASAEPAPEAHQRKSGTTRYLTVVYVMSLLFDARGGVPPWMATRDQGYCCNFSTYCRTCCDSDTWNFGGLPPRRRTQQRHVLTAPLAICCAGAKETRNYGCPERKAWRGIHMDAYDDPMQRAQVDGSSIAPPALSPRVLADRLENGEPAASLCRSISAALNVRLRHSAV